MCEILGFQNLDETNGWLGNWYPAEFQMEDRTFLSIEQWMMYFKARLFHDEHAAEQTLVLTDPAAIKALGRTVTNYNDTVWNGVRQLVVYEGLLAKFGQNPELRARLLATGSAVLAECEPKDSIWGIGLSITDPRRLDMAQWNGQNLLGFTLMEVRRVLSQA